MTSNVKKVSRTGAHIVQRAFEHIRVKQQGQNLTAEDQALGLECLNDLIKSWQREGLNLWKDTDTTLFLKKGRSKYTMGQAELLQDGTTEVNPVYGTVGDFVRTTTTAASIVTATTIDITSFTSYYGNTFDTTDTMTLLVENEDGDLDVYPITSVSTLEITITGTVTTAIESGATVYIYYDHNDVSGNSNTDRKKPLKIYPDGIRLQQSSTYEIPLTLIANDDYIRLPDKSSTGTPVQVSYTPKVDNTDICVWPPTDNVENVLMFRCQMPIDIFNVSTNESDVPSEWLRVLEWGLASELGQAYGLKLDRQMYLDQKAAVLFQRALEWDADNSSLYLMPQEY